MLQHAAPNFFYCFFVYYTGKKIYTMYLRRLHINENEIEKNLKAMKMIT